VNGSKTPKKTSAVVKYSGFATANLLLCFGCQIEFGHQVLAVDDRHDGIELGISAHVIVDEKRLRDRRRVGESGRFHQDAVEPPLSLHEPVENTNEIAASFSQLAL
jgi:hypothetical protein